VNPFWDVVDQATNTIFVANYFSGTVSVVNGATCNATDTSGCDQTPATVPTGTETSFAALDASRHTLFAINQRNDTMSEINTRTCNGGTTSGCPKFAADERLPFNPPQGENANSFALDAATGTAYIVNAGGESVLEAVSVGHCDAIDRSGCRIEEPTVPQAEFFPVIDEATQTLYAGNTFAPLVDVFNAATCRPGHLSSCTPVAEIPMPDPQANLDAIDETTHTLYAADPFGNTISVINTATCNASVTSGCGDPTPKITTPGPAPGPPVLDAATHTLYASYEENADRIAVINTRRCNARDSSGCNAHQGVVAVPQGAFLIALSEGTNTVYAPSVLGNTVAVINGASCNASGHLGCHAVAANVRVGSNPEGLAVSDATHTLYVANGAFANTPGTMSIVDTRACNGADPSGCTRTWPTVRIGRGADFVAVDGRSGHVYAADSGNGEISVLGGDDCNAQSTGGCPRTASTIAIAGVPDTFTIDQRTNTVYSDTGVGFGSLGGIAEMSVFPGAA
jgi:DNA-binding beta-propeller fold protein YncE